MVEPVGVVAGGDEQLPCGVIADAVHGEQTWGDVVEDRADVGSECSSFFVEAAPAASDAAQCATCRASTVMSSPGRHRSAMATCA